MKILIADSLKGNLFCFKRGLTNTGHILVTVQSGNEVLAILNNSSLLIEIVIIDADLLGPMHGFKLIEIIRRDFPDLPWLMTGASYSHLITDKAKFLEKPFSPDDLLRVAEKIVKGH